MQLDLLGEEVKIQENQDSSKKVKRPQKHFPKIEAKADATEQPLPELPESLRAPFIADEAALDDGSEKAPGAFKTISEAAKFLDVPQHVLRFWESRFSQIKPLKLNGGRRYYRPQDMDILATIKHLLYKQGYTIKGAKKAFLNDKQQLPVLTMAAEVAASPAYDKSNLVAVKQELMSMRDSLKKYVTP